MTLLALTLAQPQTKNKKSTWRPSRAESKDGFITHITRPMVNVKGTNYSINMVLTLDVHDLCLPTFGSIECIYLCDESVILFECSILKTLQFDVKKHCFEVEHCNVDNVYYRHDDICSHVPNTLTMGSHGSCKYYITMRSPV